MDKLKMQSPNLVDDNINKIAVIFPNCITEDHDEKGNVRRAVDFDLLRQELSHNLVEGPQERYTLNWPGKRESILAANAPIAKTLRPCEEESVNFDTTQNLFIEGDNLEALKLLQETYLNKVKMIYIDPPYNTGNDFIYEDDFTEDTESFLKRSNQKDEEGNRLVANTDSNGRFHSDWLSMMYPRLKLARNLLKDDGVIFISIGHEELYNLLILLNEIFGTSCFKNIITIRRGIKSVQAQFDTIDSLNRGHEYVLFYSKNSDFRFDKFYIPNNEDEEPEGSWNNHWRGTDRPTMRYEIFGIKPKSGQWRWSKERSTEAINNWELLCKDLGQNPNQLEIDKWIVERDKKTGSKTDILKLSSTGKPVHYIRPAEGKLASDLWTDIKTNGSAQLKKIFGTKYFDNPKSIDLLKRLIEFTCTNKDIIFDFFSGSATTAHAVMQLNAEDGGRRKFIMVQLPEPTYEIKDCQELPKKEAKIAFEAGYKTIAEIGKERIRRAGKKIKEENPETTQNLDIGFRVFKVDSSNMEDVYYTPDEVKQGQLTFYAENIKEDRRPEDLLFQVFLDWGLELTLPVVKETIEGKTVFFVDNNVLAACFDTGITEELVKCLAKRKPLRAVFRDSSYGSDSVKINVEQIFKLLSPHTDVRTI